MNEQAIFMSIASVLFGMVLVWFVLIRLLFKRLEVAHPSKYESMGRPSLFLRNNIAAGWATMKFLLAREHRPLNDSYLSKLADSMLGFVVVYSLLFFGLIAYITSQSAHAA